jgi:diguanylate cyclase (GGDEF)-like protein
MKVRLYTDISRQVELEQLRNSLDEQLSQSILTDRITGLLNQRGVMLALEPQVARSRRYNSPMAIIMMDLSGGADDERLRVQVAGLLKDQLRWADLVGCSEQREFILVLPETTGEAALRLAEKLTRRVEEMADRDNGSGSVNTCYGVTDWRRSDSAATLLGRAAQALSQARSAHRPNPVAL